MSSKLSYKRKNRLLLIGLFPLAMVIYTFAIKRTFEVRSQIKELEGKLEMVVHAPENSALLKEQMNFLDRRILASTNMEKMDLLEYITDYVRQNKIVLREFPGSLTIQKGSFFLETNRVVLKGTFKDLLTFSYDAEKNNRQWNIASVLYTIKKDPVKRDQILTATVYFQNIKKK